MITLKFLDEIKYVLIFVIALLCGVNFLFFQNPVLSPSIYSYASTAEADIFETTVLTTQLNRAKSLRNADTIIIGDSSALMDIDASELSKVLQKNVQNLSTMGYVGPAGYRSLLELYFSNNQVLDTLIIQINPIILSNVEMSFTNMTYENQAISKSMSYKYDFPKIGMEYVRRNVMGNVLPTPLPGRYGEKYRFRRLMENYLDQHNGSMFDPLPDLKDEAVGSKPVKIEISEPVRRRLIILRQFLDENNHRIGKKLLILAPTNLRSASLNEIQERNLAAKEVASILGIELKNVINPIEHLPDHLFVGYHHMTRQGQEVFTRLLEKKLVGDKSHLLGSVDKGANK